MSCNPFHRLSARRSLTATAALLSLAALSPALAAELPERLKSPEQVEPISAEDFERVLDFHRGKVILVNLWATWCIPCVQELPDLNLLQERYRDRGLEVLAVSFDEADTLEEKVRPFFAKRAPELVSYLQSEDDQYDFVAVLSDEWFGALPTTFILDRQGEVVLSQAGRMLYVELEREIISLLDAGEAGAD